MDLGFREYGFDPILAIDIDKQAVESYNHNQKPPVAIEGDLSGLRGRDIIRLLDRLAPDIRPRGVIGGPPCQSFSRANVRERPEDPRHDLPLFYAEILRALNKKYTLDFFVFENVVGLKSKKHTSRYGHILKELENAGFEVYEQELNAIHFGVAQHRRRIFVVGINRVLYPNMVFAFPEGTGVNEATVRDKIGGLLEPHYFVRNANPAVFPVHRNHWTMNPKSTKFNRPSAVTESCTKTNGRSFRRLQWDKPSWTVAYGNREIHIHPNGHRRLSVFEAMLLQGFPDSYELCGNFSQQVRQVSDAVPPPLASAIAAAIRNLIYSKEEAIQEHLFMWYESNQRRFPWRETGDPYAILIAEKLLQQTAVGVQVVESYETLLRLYPRVDALAAASITDVERCIAPLGLQYRATELVSMAQAIVRNHDNRVPDNLDSLLHLPGVGDYVARAVLCFAFDVDVPIVDSNVARFLHRVYALPTPLPANPARNKTLLRQAENLIPKKRARDFNFALLDLCAGICSSTNPQCDACCIAQHCAFGQVGSRGA